MSMADRHEKCMALVRKYYADVPTRDSLTDATVLPWLSPGQRIMDAGCGDQLPLINRYAPHVKFAVGVDVVTPSTKPAPNAAVTISDLGALPFQDETFDLVVSRSVVEHLEYPRKVFAEFRRILRPGGRIVLATPNKYYYSCLVAMLVPYRLKDTFMRWLHGEGGYDHFPVFYRANTRGALRAIAAEVGLRVTHVEAIRHFPYYFLFSPMLFRVGMLYDWLITWLRLDSLQSNWFVVLERPETP
jgi:SAM-dependent methyltransferase